MSTESTKTIKGRIINKHGTEESWILSVYTDLTKTTLRDNPFIPFNGELIIYDPDSIYTYRRIKIGDGKTYVTDLPFATDPYQAKTDDTLETQSKEIVGAINEINEKALVNADGILLANVSSASYEGAVDGIVYDGTFWAYTGEADKDVLEIPTTVRIPIVEGENVTFEVDNKNQVVKINAIGGEIDTSKFVSKYTIETGASTTVLDVINAIQNAGGNIGEWNVIVLTGYITETWGLQISHYGSTVYNIQGVNLNNMKTVSSTTSWSGVTLGSFQVMFKSAIPYCDASNAGQFLRVDANGNPAWSAIPNAEEATF